MSRRVIESLQGTIGLTLIVTFLAGCGASATTSVTLTSAPPTDTSRPVGQGEAHTFEELLVSADEYRLQRDLANALTELALAESLIEDRSPENREYSLLLLMKAETYSWFELLDEAEAALLRATGIPDEYVDRISDSRNPLSEEEFREIADDIQQLVSQTDLAGYHVALSLIYNILGDIENLLHEQQAAMDVSVDQDITLSTALELYEVRQRKNEVHSALEQQILQVQQEPDDWAEQCQLASLYHLAGWFPEAQEITERYLSLLNPEDDKEAYLCFLFMKMNLEMSLGHYEGMKECEVEILTIDPHALDEFIEGADES